MDVTDADVDGFVDAVGDFLERQRGCREAPRRSSTSRSTRPAASPSRPRASPTRRPAGRVDRRHLRRVFDRIGVIQIDSVNVLVRSQELPLFARLGPHPRTLHPRRRRRRRAVRVLGPHGGHRPDRPPPAVPLADGARPPVAVAQRARAATPRLRRQRPRVRPRATGRSSPASCSSGSGRRARGGTGTTARCALEYLFFEGRLAVRRRRSDFARLYDVPERFLPAAGARRTDAAPRPRPARRLLELAARSMGVATLGRPRRLPPPGHGGVPAAGRRAGRGRPAASRCGSRAGTEVAYLHADAALPRRVDRHGRCSARSTRWCGTASATCACSTSTTASRSTRRRRSGSTATTCCRSCSTARSSAAST